MMGLFSLPFWLASAQLVRPTSFSFSFPFSFFPFPSRAGTPLRSIIINASIPVPFQPLIPPPQTKQTVSPLVVTERVMLGADGSFALEATAVNRTLAVVRGSLDDVTEARERRTAVRVYCG